MKDYEFWVDAYNKSHEISKMDTAYIRNCLKELQKMNDVWKNAKCDSLTDSELKLSNEVGQKAWYVENGKSYLSAFLQELAYREKGK